MADTINNEKEKYFFNYKIKRFIYEKKEIVDKYDELLKSKQI